MTKFLLTHMFVWRVAVESGEDGEKNEARDAVRIEDRRPLHAAFAQHAADWHRDCRRELNVRHERRHEKPILFVVSASNEIVNFVMKKFSGFNAKCIVLINICCQKNKRNIYVQRDVKAPIAGKFDAKAMPAS